MKALKHNTKELKMSDAIIDEVMKESSEANARASEAAAPEAQEPIENEQVEQPQEEQQAEEPDGAEEQPNEEGEESEVIFPKKAVNAISRRDKKIAKLQAQYQEAVQKLEAAQKAQESAPKETARPDADDFDSFDEYLDALVDYRAETRGQQKAEPENKQEPQLSESQIKEQMYYAERAKDMDAKYADYQSKLSDFESLANENADILQSFSPEITKAVYETDDAALALYVLAKEDALEELSTMNPIKAAATLAKAEVRGQKYLKPRQSKAPAPIKGARGTTQRNKTYNDMDPDEIVKRFIK